MWHLPRPHPVLVRPPLIGSIQRACTVSFLQIVTQLEFVYDIRFPPAYEALLDALSFVNLDLLHWLPALAPNCFGLAALSTRLLVLALVPLAVVVAVPAVRSCSCSRQRDDQPLLDSLPFILGWTFLLFPPISSLGFRSLAPCDCFEYIDGAKTCFLREDYEIECTGSFLGRPAAPLDVQAAAWVAIVVWAVGVPLLYSILLVANSTDKSTGVNTTTHLRRALGFFIDDYHPGSNNWELVVVAQKLALTGFLALFQPGEWTQLFAGTVVTLYTFVIQARIAPHHTPSDNLFGFLSSSMLVTIFLASLGVQAGALAPELGVDSVFILAILFAATLLVVVVAVAFFAAEVYSASEVLHLQSTRRPPSIGLPPNKRYHVFLSHSARRPPSILGCCLPLRSLPPASVVSLVPHATPHFPLHCAPTPALASHMYHRLGQPGRRRDRQEAATAAAPLCARVSRR